MWTSLTLALLGASLVPPFAVVGLSRDDGSCATSLGEERRVGPRTILERGCDSLELWTELEVPEAFEHELVLQRAPGQRGPLRVRLSTPGEWLGVDALGHRFLAADGRTWTYGAAFLLVDGRRVQLEVSRTAQGLEVQVPERWLHAWPLHIDPLVTTELRLEVRSPGLGEALEAQLEPAVTFTPIPSVVWSDYRHTASAPDLFGLNADDGGLYRLVLRARPQHHPVLVPWGDGGVALAFEEENALGQQLVTVQRIGPGNTVEATRPGRSPALAVGPQGEVYVALADNLAPKVFTLDEFFTDGGQPLFFDPATTALATTDMALCVSGAARGLAVANRDPVSQHVAFYVSTDAGWGLSRLDLADGGAGLERPSTLCTDDVVWLSTWNRATSRSHLLRTVPGQGLSAPYVSPVREPSLVLVQGQARMAGVASNAVVLVDAETAVAGSPGVITLFSRPTQPAQDGLVVAAGDEEFLLAWTWGALRERNLSVVRFSKATDALTGLPTAKEHQQGVRITTVQGQTLAVWRTGRRTLRARWLSPTANPAPFTLGPANVDLEDLCVASNDDTAVVAWREGTQLRWLTVPPGATSGTEQIQQLSGAVFTRVVSDGSHFWLTGFDLQRAFALDLGTGRVPGTVSYEKALTAVTTSTSFAAACLDGVCSVGRIAVRNGVNSLEVVAFPSTRLSVRANVSGPMALTRDDTTLRLVWQEGRELYQAELAAGEFSPDAGSVLRQNLNELRALEASLGAPVFIALGTVDNTLLFPLAAADDPTLVPGAYSPSLSTFGAGPLMGFHRFNSSLDVNEAFVLAVALSPDAGVDGGVDAGLDAGAPDAGADAGLAADGGLAMPDAGPVTTDLVASGCACQSSDGVLVALLTALLARRFLRRNHS